MHDVASSYGNQSALEMMAADSAPDAEVDQGLSPNSQFWLVDSRSLYASEACIDHANASLREQGAILFKKGAMVDNPTLDGPTLYAVSPILQDEDSMRERGIKDTAAVSQAVRACLAFSEREGDSAEDVAAKQAAYAGWLNDVRKETKMLAADLVSFAHTLMTNGVLDMDADLTDEQWKAAVDVMQSWMLKHNTAAQFIDEARLRFEQNHTVQGVLRFAADLPDLPSDDRSPDEHALLLPTDCNTAALLVSDNNAGRDNEDPGVGETHFVDFAGGGLGWVNHWGAVVMKDGDATITLENAADPTKGPVDMSTWYFAKFGSGPTSFGSIMDKKHAARTAELRDAGVTD